MVTTPSGGLTCRQRWRLPLLVAVLAAFGCAPPARIPVGPVIPPGALAPADSLAAVARRLAPVLFLQRDEPFDIERVVAVVDTARRIIGYHVLWRDDVSGAWLPFTSPTDQEIAWVGYDSTGAPTDLWTYWHGSVLHAEWRDRGQPAVNVQWGKHGFFPRGMRLPDLPRGQSLSVFYALTWLSVPDFALGRTERSGPWCFCHGYTRYLEFTRPVVLGSRIDAVVRAESAAAALPAVFGRPYSGKRLWPEE